MPRQCIKSFRKQMHPVKAGCLFAVIAVPACSQDEGSGLEAGELIVEGEVGLVEYDDSVQPRGGLLKRLFGG